MDPWFLMEQECLPAYVGFECHESQVDSRGN